MDVEAAEAGGGQYRARQDQSIGRDNCRLGPERKEFRLHGFVAQTCRTTQCEAMGLRERLHRRRLQSMAAPGWTGRLGIDGTYPVTDGDQLLKDRRGKGRRAHKDEIQHPLPSGGWSHPQPLGGNEVARALCLCQLAQDHSPLDR